MKTRLILIALAASFLLFGCAGQLAPTACTEEAKICPDGSSVGRIGPDCEFAPCPSMMPGSDRDAHGCIPSAGYSWCEEKQKCLRIWEENCTSLENPEEPMVGNNVDEYGCIGSAGYVWCEKEKACIRPWENDCATGAAKCSTYDDCPPGAARCVNGTCTQYDEHGCVPDGGYEWCEALQKCIQPWEENCTGTNGGIPPMPE